MRRFDRGDAGYAPWKAARARRYSAAVGTSNTVGDGSRVMERTYNSPSDVCCRGGGPMWTGVTTAISGPTVMKSG